jgi:pimeloyl-ACP methyl ester carboxylesterase
MAETIYMVHGMCGGAWVWDNYRSFFESQGYRCVATTLRFHDIDPQDAPPQQLGTTGLLDYALDLEIEIRRLGSPPILMGHSMGGLLTQILAGRGLGKALVLLAPAAPAGILCLKPTLVRGFGSILLSLGWWNKPIRHTFQEAAYGMLHSLPVNDQRAIYERFVYESGRAGFEAGFWFFDPKQAARVDESKVSCPVLVAAGARDRLAFASVMRQIAGKYGANATYHEFADHAHWLVAEPGWQDVAEYVSAWLERVLGSV